MKYVLKPSSFRYLLQRKGNINTITINSQMFRYSVICAYIFALVFYACYISSDMQINVKKLPMFHRNNNKKNALHNSMVVRKASLTNLSLMKVI